MYHLDTPVLHTSRLTLRAPQARDWPAMAGFLTSERAAHVGGPVTRERAWRSFGHVVGHWMLRGYGMFFLTETGADDAIGMAGPWFPEGWPEQEIGWSVFAPAAEGKGYAAEAARAALAHAFGPLGWRTAVSYIDPANARSIALAERLGATTDTSAATPDPADPTLVYRHHAPPVPA